MVTDMSGKIRKPVAPPTVKHSGKKGKKGYTRKPKHRSNQHAD